jgi:predicted DNA-binding transcriptional regulator YafY
MRQLAHATATRTPVTITCESAARGITRRVIDSIDLSGGTLFAWCELRRDERVFTLSRIQSVIAV